MSLTSLILGSVIRLLENLVVVVCIFITFSSVAHLFALEVGTKLPGVRLSLTPVE